MDTVHTLPWRSRIACRVRGWPFGDMVVSIARSFFGEGQPHDQWQRVVMNRTVRALVDKLHPASLEVLEISGWSWPTEGYFKRHRAVSYPDYDVCEGPLPDRFDLIIAEQVFEHLLWPYRAGKHVHEMLRPGGCFLISTPFLVKIHRCPHDCTRWTETGLRYFLAESGFPLEEICTGSWGNRACVKANLKRWQVYQRWRHSLRRQETYPIQVWALARKI